jgi:hypothetical protein
MNHATDLVLRAELAACSVADHGSNLLEAARHTRNCNQ